LDERDELALERLDLRHLSSYAIDNAWSNDPDDAISFDGERIWIHVADPASILSPTSKLDAEAMARGSTLYLPERTIPMLHTSFVQALGLGLAPESKALSFGIRLKEDGRIADTLIVPSMVKVERLTYEQADAMLAGNPILQQLRALADIRAALRRSRGAVDIDFPEVSIKVQGEEPTFLPVPQTLSARIVQECMILAGEAAARWAYERKVPFPFASQDPPTSMNLSSGEPGPSRSLAENFGRRRVMKAAIISTTCAAHAGLGLSFYTQVTSPLRRYQDLLAHYQIHAILAKERRSKHFGAAADAPIPLDSETMDARALRLQPTSGEKSPGRERFPRTLDTGVPQPAQRLERPRPRARCFCRKWPGLYSGIRLRGTPAPSSRNKARRDGHARAAPRLNS